MGRILDGRARFVAASVLWALASLEERFRAVKSYDLVQTFLREKKVLPYDIFDRLSAYEKDLAFSTALRFEQDLLKALAEELRLAMAEGASSAEFRQRADKVMGAFGRRVAGIPAHRLDLIFVQETTRAFNSGLYAEAFGRTGMEIAEVWEFVARKETVLHDPEHNCSKMNGKLFWKTDRDAWTKLPQLHFRCLAEETPVEGLFRTGFRSVYTGEMVQIKTQAGRRLTVTGDHPVFTAVGLIPARDLHEGAHVFRYRRDVEPLPGVDDQHVPPTAAEVFRALEKAGTRPVAPLGSVDLYGNAGRKEGEIDVVTIDRMLAGHTAEGRGEFALVASGTRDGSCEPERMATDLVVRDGAPPRRLPRRSALAFDGGPIALDQRPFQGLRFGATARLDAVLAEDAVDDESRHAALLRDAVDRGAGTVALDEVVLVRKVDAVVRPVVDFEGAHGVIVADGIAVGNCRCIAVSRQYRPGMKVEKGNAVIAFGDEGFSHDKLTPLRSIYGPSIGVKRRAA